MERIKMIEFDGIDIVIRSHVDDMQARHAIATSLGIDDERVALIDDVANYPARNTYDVVCVKSLVNGSFVELLSVQANKTTLPYDDSNALLQRISESLGTQILAPAEGANPYVVWLITPCIAARKVGLNPAALDAGTYQVDRDPIG